MTIKEFFLNILFPIFCVNCQKEGSYLCDDCLSLIDIAQNQYCPFCQPPKIVSDGKTCYSCGKNNKSLSGLYNAASYKDFIIKKMIGQYKYEPYAKELSKSLACLIIKHFQLLEKEQDFSQAFLIPVPLAKKRLRLRGFNQAEALCLELSLFLKIPLISDVLLKTKETRPQAELSGKEREENIKGAFLVQNKEKVLGREILLVDDVFTTGATMEECALALKLAGAKEIWGVTVARG